MASSASRLPLGLGRIVRRHTDPSDNVGVIVGLLFAPSRLALVRWRLGESTFEAPDSLVEVHTFDL